MEVAAFPGQPLHTHCEGDAEHPAAYVQVDHDGCGHGIDAVYDTAPEGAAPARSVRSGHGLDSARDVARSLDQRRGCRAREAL